MKKEIKIDRLSQLAVMITVMAPMLAGIYIFHRDMQERMDRMEDLHLEDIKFHRDDLKSHRNDLNFHREEMRRIDEKWERLFERMDNRKAAS